MHNDIGLAMGSSHLISDVFLPEKSPLTLSTSLEQYEAEPKLSVFSVGDSLMPTSADFDPSKLTAELYNPQISRV